jgi:hypothetical protein
MKRYFSFLMLLFSSQLLAQQNVYTFDVSVANVPPSAFENETRQYPKSSDFVLQVYHPMSTQEGERAALVTIKNTASGKRFFEAEHVLALLANGERVTPTMAKQKYALEGGESLTVTLEFGKHDYPLISVYTSEN